MVMRAVDKRRLQQLEEGVINRIITFHINRFFNLYFTHNRKHRPQIKPSNRCRMVQKVQQIAATTGLAQGCQPQSGQNFAYVMSDIQKILRQGPRVAIKRFGIGCQTCRTFDVAVFSHNTFQHHQRGGTKFKTIPPQKCRFNHVRACLVCPRTP